MGFVLFLLAAYLVVSYREAIHLPFLNDDYFFLEKVRQSSFWDLWKPERLIFNWYRPLSRETHYWLLDRVAGSNELIHHLVSWGLWLAVMALFLLLVRRMAGHSVSVVSTAGLAVLALWSGPLTWVAGAQDLWMLLFSLLFLHAIVSSRTTLALVPMVLALLSKETAAILPALAAAYSWIVRGDRPLDALRRTAVLWLTLIVWMLAHPTLGARIFGPLRHSLETEVRPSPGATLLMTLLAQVNLEGRLAPEVGWGAVIVPGALGAMLLGLLVFLALRRKSSDLGRGTRPTTDRQVLVFSAVWAGLGWGILFLPSIGWHAYYGVLGSLGFWVGVGILLAPHRRAALAVVLVLAFIREARAATPSWDWGSDWYQTRAGALLSSIRQKLYQLHPGFPRGSRLYFARLPNNIGLLAGNGPALRIWYDEDARSPLLLGIRSARS